MIKMAILNNLMKFARIKDMLINYGRLVRICMELRMEELLLCNNNKSDII